MRPLDARIPSAAAAKGDTILLDLFVWALQHTLQTQRAQTLQMEMSVGFL